MIACCCSTCNSDAAIGGSLSLSSAPHSSPSLAFENGRFTPRPRRLVLGTAAVTAAVLHRGRAGPVVHPNARSLLELSGRSAAAVSGRHGHVQHHQLPRPLERSLLRQQRQPVRVRHSLHTAQSECVWCHTASDGHGVGRQQQSLLATSPDSNGHLPVPGGGEEHTAVRSRGTHRTDG